MARIAFLDDSFPFTGHMLRTTPLGSIQSATIGLAEALAARGHQVAVHGMVASDENVNGVLYRPLFTPWGGEVYDLVIANSVAKLFAYAKGRKKALWLHGHARYLRKARHAWPFLRYRPRVVFLGDYHRSSWPKYLPLFGSSQIPLGIEDAFLQVPEQDKTPAPRAVFVSNPRRKLDWVLDVWAEHIYPKMPGAQLHVFAGRNQKGMRRSERMDKILEKIASHINQGVVRHEPRPKEDLLQIFAESRVMLHAGDDGEAFCLAAAEAQAAGVPLVTANYGGGAEQVLDGQTGFVCENPKDFADATLRLLRDDVLWRAQHQAAQDKMRDWSWARVADAWEAAFDIETP